MSQIRVLIVDDSLVVRRMLSQILSQEQDVTVIGTAKNGKEAIEQVRKLEPDLVTLDIDMPVLNGLEALAKIRQEWPRQRVIMLSSRTQHGAAATVEALSLGASSYISKPSGTDDGPAARQVFHDRLLRQIRAVCAREFRVNADSLVAKPRRMQGPVTPVRRPRPRGKITVVAIAASTGGPSALAEVISKLPSSFPVPILIVQHMPPVFTASLAERLNRHSKLLVQEGKPNESVRAGSAWVAPGAYHMKVSKETRVSDIRLLMDQDPPENYCRPAADVLFRSVAETYGAGVLAVVLTGMGRDGVKGCELVRKQGGTILVQDEESSVVWGMPGFVAGAGLADGVFPLSQLADQITATVASTTHSQSVHA